MEERCGIYNIVGFKVEFYHDVNHTCFGYELLKATCKKLKELYPELSSDFIFYFRNYEVVERHNLESHPCRIRFVIRVYIGVLIEYRLYMHVNRE